MASIESLQSGVVIRRQSRFGALAGDLYVVSTQNPIPIHIPPLIEPRPYAADPMLLRPRAECGRDVRADDNAPKRQVDTDAVLSLAIAESGGPRGADDPTRGNCSSRQEALCAGNPSAC
jgi:hypothetical protein